MEDSFAVGYAMGADSNNNRSNNNGGAFGDGNGAIWLIFILAILFGGWGNGNRGSGNSGGGNNGGGDSMAAFLPYIAGSVTGGQSITRADLCQDMNFGQLENGVRGIADGLCSLGYDQLAQINGVNSNIAAMGANLNNAVCTLGYQNAQLINGLENTVQQGFNASNIVALQNANAAQAQLADCCCKTQTNLMQLGNQIDRNFCTTNFNDQANTTAIIQNAHNDTDRILARLDAMESARKDELIAELRSKLANCGDQTTAQYIINQITSILNPRAVPAYPAASPCGLGNWSPAVLANGWGGFNTFGNGGCCGCNG